MLISGINYTSDTNLFNKVYQNRTSSSASRPYQEPREEVQTPNAHKVKSLAVALGAIALFALGSIKKLANAVRKFIKVVQSEFRAAEIFTAGKPKRTFIDGVEVLEPEVVDTRFLSPRSKLRMRPEIEDVAFEEIAG